MNFNPEMFNNFKHMINPQMMREMGNNINSMSDEQLKVLLNSMGKNIHYKFSRHGKYYPPNV